VVVSTDAENIGQLSPKLREKKKHVKKKWNETTM